jgi:hypothetical protein
MSNDISETYIQIWMKSFLIRQFTAQCMNTYNLQKLHDFDLGFQFAYAIKLCSSRWTCKCQIINACSESNYGGAESLKSSKGQYLEWTESTGIILDPGIV